MRVYLQLFVAILCILVGVGSMNGQKPERVGYRVSEFGKYVGYSQPLYDG
jgi:hypothetical protein